MRAGTPPADASLSLLLGDYRERSDDLRRQLAYYGQLFTFALAVVATALGWVLSKGASYTWLLPFAALFVETILLLAVFVYRSSELMRTYLIRLEHHLNSLFGPTAARHMADGCSGPTVVFGFHGWRAASRASPPVQRRLALGRIVALVAISSVLAGLALPGLDHPSLAAPSTRWPLVALLVVLPLVAVGLLARARAHVWQERAQLMRDFIAPNAPRASLPVAQVAMVLDTDYEQRNNDFRDLADNYPRLLVLALTILATATGFHLDAPVQNRWVFLFAPPLLLALCLAMLVVFRQVKYVKRYTKKVEAWMEEVLIADPTLCAEPTGSGRAVHVIGTGAATTSFHVGFFRIVRERHFAQTAGLRVPPAFLAIAMGVGGALVAVLARSVDLAHAWLVTTVPEAAEAITVASLVVNGTLVAAGLVLFGTASAAGRDPPPAPMPDGETAAQTASAALTDTAPALPCEDRESTSGAPASQRGAPPAPAP